MIGLIVSAGWWHWLLAREFGNPVFPLLNDIFGSPDFPMVALGHDRFRVHGIVDALTLPFRMVEVRNWIYVENGAPDLRWAVLVLASVALVVRQIANREAARVAPEAGSSGERFVVWFFALATLFWVLTNANGRYAIPLMLLVGPIVYRALYAILKGSPRAIGLGLLLLVAQVVHASQTGNPRCLPVEWGDRWVEASIPGILKDQSFGYLTVGTEPSSFLIPFLNPDSSFANVSGLYSVDPDGPGADRVRRMIERLHGKLRVMFRREGGAPDDLTSAKVPAAINAALRPWRLEVDDSAVCNLIRVEARRHDTVPPAVSLSVQTCELVPAEAEAEAVAAERRRVARVSDLIHQACPLLFSPAGMYPVFLRGGWQVGFLNTDIVMYERQGRLSYSRYDFGPFDVDLGTVTDWEAGKGTVRCESLTRNW
jgi:hypothetical protein